MSVSTMPAFQLTLDAIEPLRIRTSRPAATQRVVVVSEAGSSKLPSTKTNACLVSSSFCNSRRCPPPLDLATVSVDVANNATAHSVSFKPVRPLPPIPNTAPATLSTRHQTPSSSLRRLPPLPSPPSSCTHSDSSTCTSSPETSRCSTPTTSSEDSDLSHSVRSLPTLAPLAMNDPSLKSPALETIDVSSPCSPIPSTPQTAKRKRVEKLRRHLGEPIPYSAVYDHVRHQSVYSKAHVLAKVQGPEIRTYVKAAIAARKILELSHDMDDDTDDSMGSGSENYEPSSEDGEVDLAIQENSQEDYTWVLENGTAFRAVDRCYSSKWVYEKGGERWEEPDYKRVIEALRAL